MRAASVIVQSGEALKAAREATARVLAEMQGARADLAVVFVSDRLAEDYAAILGEILSATGARLLVGCSGHGVIGRRCEVEEEAALALLLVSLPGATFRPYHFTQAQVEESSGPGFWHVESGIDPADAHAWLLLADPFSIRADRLVRELNGAYPEAPLIGGMASADPHGSDTALFLNTEVLDHGAVGVAMGGAWTLHPVVSQGCRPIGQPWIITRADRNLILEIGRKPAYEALMETLRSLSEEDRQRASGNLLIGLAVNEYQEEFRRGDFLIRNILGVDPAGGVLAVGAFPRVGQTMQFQLRDAAAADEDLHHLLVATKRELDGRPPAAALLFCCNGRGRNLFQTPHHDTSVLADHLGPLPVAGFFCNGEIGPVGNRAFVHGFTASIALFVPPR